MMGRLADFTVSSDLYHCSEAMGDKPQNALVAAKWLNIPTGLISVAQPEASEMEAEEAGAVMFRGRAAAELAPRAAHHPWRNFPSCDNEDLRDPGRLPAWEKPNMLAKYYVTTKAVEMSRKK